MTPADLLARELRRDSARPLITWYDDAIGARIELSVATVANWAAKIANLLVDEHDIEPGDPIGVQLPTHWETAVVLLGCWTAGAHVLMGESADVGFGSNPTAAVQLSLDPMGADLARAVSAQPDQYGGGPVDPHAAALTMAGRSWTHAELGAAAEHGAREHGLDAASRILSTMSYDTVDGLDAGLLVPLAAGSSVVLVSNADPARFDDRVTTERATHVAGPLRLVRHSAR